MSTAEKYLKEKDQDAILHADYEWVQVFHHKFGTDRSFNESETIRWFSTLSYDEKKMGTELLVFLSRFWFITTPQLQLLFKLNKVSTDSVSTLLKTLLDRHVINCFTLSSEPMQEFPKNALRIYCLDTCGKHILSHFYREDFVCWRTTDVMRGAEQIVKCLSTCNFYLNLAIAKEENLITFEPIYDASIGYRNSRYSALMELSNGTENIKMILESVRTYDLPTYWRKKVSEQLAPYYEKEYWKQTFSEPPKILLLAETIEDAQLAAEILHKRLNKVRFLCTTDEEVAKGMEKAFFYKYSDANDENGNVAALLAVPAKLFTAKKSD